MGYHYTISSDLRLINQAMTVEEKDKILSELRSATNERWRDFKITDDGFFECDDCLQKIDYNGKAIEVLSKYFQGSIELYREDSEDAERYVLDGDPVTRYSFIWGNPITYPAGSTPYSIKS